MNYYILGIAIILIILMMGTKKREGYTEKVNLDIGSCPRSRGIDDLDAMSRRFTN